jgi:hypothetical protein
LTLAADDLRARKRARDVEIELRPPRAARHFFRWHVETPAADVVDEDIDRAVLGDRTPRRLLRLLRGRKVADECGDVRAEDSGLCGGGVERGPLAPHEHEVRTRLRKPECDFLAQAPATAGDHRPPPCQ